MNKTQKELNEVVEIMLKDTPIVTPTEFFKYRDAHPTIINSAVLIPIQAPPTKEELFVLVKRLFRETLKDKAHIKICWWIKPEIRKVDSFYRIRTIAFIVNK